MSFWGASPTQRNAQGRIGELGNWSYDQMKPWFQRSNDQFNQGNYWTNQGAGYWDNALRNGTPSQSVDQNRQTGQQISPGVDPFISQSGQRIQQQLDSFRNLPSAEDTGNQISGTIDEYGGAIGRNSDTNRDTINSSWLRNLQRNEGTSGDVLGNVNSTYDLLSGMNAGGYGGMKGTSAGAYSKMLNTTGNAYGDMLGQNADTYGGVEKNVALLKPGGSYQQAQVARSYAPEMVSAAGRMRAAGASPMQAEEAMQGAERDRARGMDEAASRSTGDYINALNAAKLGKLNNALALGQGQLSTTLGLNQGDLANQLGLTQNQLNNSLNFSREQGGLTRDELLRASQNAQNLDTGATSAQLANNTDTMNRTTDYLGQRANQAQLLRAMQQQDWGTVAFLLNSQNANDLLGLNLKNQQYNQGFGQNAYNDQTTGTAADRVGGYGQNATNNSIRFSQQGQSLMNDALRQYLASYGIEQPNAGWGLKLLGGLGMNLLTGGLGGLFGGGGGGGGTAGIGAMDRGIATSPWGG